VKQDAELLAVNERTAYGQCGGAAGLQGSGSWRFMEDDIRDWIEEQKKRAKDEPDNEETA
jgi:hypothetical protein